MWPSGRRLRTILVAFEDYSHCVRARFASVWCRRYDFHSRCKGTKKSNTKQAFLSFISDLFEMLNYKERKTTAFTVLRSYTVTQFHLPSSKFHFLMDIYIILLYIIYYIYNIKYFFLPKVTVQLHLMQLRNCVTV